MGMPKLDRVLLLALKEILKQGKGLTHQKGVESPFCTLLL